MATYDAHQFDICTEPGEWIFLKWYLKFDYKIITYIMKLFCRHYVFIIIKSAYFGQLCNLWLHFNCNNRMISCTVHPTKLVYNYVMLYLVLDVVSVLADSSDLFIQIYQGCFKDTKASVCYWSRLARKAKNRLVPNQHWHSQSHMHNSQNMQHTTF